VHKGTRQRAEITDAAMAGRAECVMLNKGPYLADAITLLDDVLAAMEGHQYKKAFVPARPALLVTRPFRPPRDPRSGSGHSGPRNGVTG